MSSNNPIRKRTGDMDEDCAPSYNSYVDFVEPNLDVDPDRCSSVQRRPDRRPVAGIEIPQGPYADIVQPDHAASPLKRFKQYAFGNGQTFSLVGTSSNRRPHPLLAPRPLSSRGDYRSHEVSEPPIELKACDMEFRRSGSGEEPFKRKNCDECVKRKIKCDGQQPCCTCVRKRLSCTYSYKLKPGPKVRPSSPSCTSVQNQSPCPLQLSSIEGNNSYMSCEETSMGIDSPITHPFHFNYQQQPKPLLGASRLIPSFRGLSGFKGGLDPQASVCPPLATAPVTPSLASSCIGFPELSYPDEEIPIDVTQALLALKHSK